MPEIIKLTQLDKYFADFILRIEPNRSEELWIAAALTSHATGEGHTCLDISLLKQKEIIVQMPDGKEIVAPKDIAESIINCNSIGSAGDYKPLIIEDNKRLYLQRSWSYEQQVVNSILKHSALEFSPPKGMEAGLERYFNEQTAEPDQQKKAVSSALTKGFTVISGGPGTGKTSTVARILALLVELNTENKPRILLAAPTGKAAMRLKQAVSQATDKLPISEDLRPSLAVEVSTIHRLLGVISGSTRFRKNRDNQLACDVLIIDETSMVDLPLMAHLLEALPDKARVVMLGDRDQLASVEAGAILADLCSGGTYRDHKKPLPSVIQLTKSYRFAKNSGIGLLSRLINSGDSDEALNLLISGSYSDISWRELPAGKEFGEALLKSVTELYSKYAKTESVEEAIAALEQFRVLSPNREGVYGVGNINRICSEALGFPDLNEKQYCRLLPIIITGNNYDLGLFNGDTGLFMEDSTERKLIAWFNNSDGSLRKISPLRLPPFDTAFALTVHKSQGSEFDRVLLILPEKASELLSREMLYTAVTRAKKQLLIWGKKDIFKQAVAKTTERGSGLSAKLWGK